MVVIITKEQYEKATEECRYKKVTFDTIDLNEQLESLKARYAFNLTMAEISIEYNDNNFYLRDEKLIKENEKVQKAIKALEKAIKLMDSI